jgi:hypothetical protein
LDLKHKMAIEKGEKRCGGGFSSSIRIAHGGIFLVMLADGQEHFLHDTQADPRAVDRLGRG